MKIDLNGVLAYYDLGDPLGAQPAERGYVNATWDIDTTSGRYFLKRYHPSLRNTATIRTQHTLIEHLRRSDFPAPAVLHTITDDTLLISNGEYYEVQEYVEGDFYSHEQPAHLQEAARVLGRYHSITAGFQTIALRRKELYGPVFLRRNLGKLVTAWGLEYNPSFTTVIRQLASQTDDLETRFTTHGSLPHLVIHGDYYADNLLFRDNCIVGVVDYDKAGWQPRVAELAEALVYFASPRPGPTKHIVYSGPLEWKTVERFLLHYTSVIKLNENEIRALPDYVGCIWMQVSLRRLLEQHRRPAYAAEALREASTLGEWAAVNAERMIDMVERMIRDS
jgi:Ser/Thr protein kinase RdoA (MazF antagonist)